MHHVLFIGTIVLTISCSYNPAQQAPGDNKTNFDFGTDSDSAFHYYELGWSEILDYGRWSSSEEAFRNAVKHDPGFILGWSLVGRISSNKEERVTILEHLDSRSNELNEYEQILLDIYSGNIERMNLRETGLQHDQSSGRDHMKIKEDQFRKFLSAYPNVSSALMEYIEILHANHGPKVALDTLVAQDAQLRMTHPFFIRYQSLLEAELGHIESAIQLAEEFEEVVNDSLTPEMYVLRGNLYEAMDNIEMAQIQYSLATSLDSSHLIAQSNKNRLESLIKDLR